MLPEIKRQALHAIDVDKVHFLFVLFSYLKLRPKANSATRPYTIVEMKSVILYQLRALYFGDRLIRWVTSS